MSLVSGIFIRLLLCTLQGTTFENVSEVVISANVAAWLVTGDQHAKSAMSLLQQPHRLSIPFLVQFKVLVMTFKALYGIGPG